jgi:P-type E1-E2 ATPase
MLDLVKSLKIDSENIYGQFHAKERMELVSELQASGAGVAYIGYVLSDMPALSQADVSIGIEVDADSIFTSCICDIVIGPDVHWLPRMIMLSRRVNHTTTSNFGLLLGTSLATAIGAGLNWFSPLTTVLVSDIPVVLAALRNIAAMNTHGVLESHAHKHKTHQVIEQRAMACRLPSARPHRITETTSVPTPAIP